MSMTTRGAMPGAVAAIASPHSGVIAGLRSTAKKLQTIAAGTAAQLKVAYFGDSVAGKVWGGIEPVMLGLTGMRVGGGFYGPHSGSTTTNATSGSVTENATDFDAWPSGLTQTIPAGASRTYGMGGGSYPGCDRVKVYYVKEASAGTFKIQIDGVDAAGFTNVSAVGTLGQLGIASISPTRGAHTITVVGLTGSVRIIGIVAWDSTQPGLLTMGLGQGGIMLNAAASTAWSNFQAYLADITPDLFLFEMKEDSSYYAASLATLFTATKTGAPNMDVIGIGSTPYANPTNDADQLVQNAQLRAACQAKGYVYYDTYALFGSYAAMQALGWEGDGVHVSVEADKFRGMRMLHDLGLLDAYGVNPIQRQKRSAVYFGRDTEAAIARIVAEPTFGLDLDIVVNRFLSIKNAAGTEIARYWDGAGNSYLPDRARLGSSSGPALMGDSASLVSVRRGDSMGNPADLNVRSLIVSPYAANISGAVTIDPANGGMQLLTLTGNVTSVAFGSAASNGQIIIVQWIQDATGSRTISGVNGSIHLGGGSITLTTTATRRDVSFFMAMSGGWYEFNRYTNIA